MKRIVNILLLGSIAVGIGFGTVNCKQKKTKNCFILGESLIPLGEIEEKECSNLSILGFLLKANSGNINLTKTRCIITTGLAPLAQVDPDSLENWIAAKNRVDNKFANLNNGDFSVPLLDIFHDGSRWIGAGTYGTYYSNSNGVWEIGVDYRTDDARESSKLINLRSITRGVSGKVVASGGASIIWSSPDGLTWPNATISKTSKNYSYYGSAYGEDRFVIVGNNQATFPSNIEYSTDGISWTPSDYSTQTETLKAVVYGNSLFVTVGESGSIVTSPNGQNWTSQTSGTTDMLNSVAYGKNTYVAGGVGGIVLTSTNGTTWVPRSSGVTKEIESLTFDYGRGRFIATLKESNTLLVSSDGVSWEKINANIPNGRILSNSKIRCK